MRSPVNSSTYLFTKENYVEEVKNPIEAVIEASATTDEEVVDDNFDIADLEDEEIPDYLKDENIDFIG